LLFVLQPFIVYTGNMKTHTQVTVFFALLIAASATFGQKGDNAKVDLAMERAKLAAESLKAVAALPEGKGIPKDVIDNALMIGIVPDASRLSVLFSRATRGHGVMSMRTADKQWSLPAFCLFYSAPGFKLSGVGNKNIDAVFVMTGADVIGQAKNSNNDAAKAKEALKKIKIFSYAFSSGGLKLISSEPLFDSSFGLAGFFKDSPSWKKEESFNKAVYGAKGGEVLDGKIADTKIQGTAVTDFRDALNELFPIQ
jgi:hypothetical protein